MARKRGTGRGILRLMIDCDTRSRDWLLHWLKADIWLTTMEWNS